MRNWRWHYYRRTIRYGPSAYTCMIGKGGVRLAILRFSSQQFSRLDLAPADITTVNARRIEL